MKPVRFLTLVAVTIACGAAAFHGSAQDVTRDATAKGKPRLAIRAVDATPSVLEQSKGNGSALALRQILEGTQRQIENSIEQTRKFEIVARQDLKEVLKEQDLGGSGLVKEGGQTPKSMELEGAGYVLTVTVDNFQDVTTRATIEGQLGAANKERREIQLQAVVKIFDSTKGTLLRSTSENWKEFALNDVRVGQTQEGRATNELLGKVAALVAAFGANEITDFVFPAKVMAFTNGVLTFNRTKDSGVASGQWWQVFAPGEEMFDPDTGESLGAEEVAIGWAKVTDAGSKFSKAQGYEDMGIDCGSILRPFQGEGDPPNASNFRPSNGFCDRSGGAGRSDSPTPSRAAPGAVREESNASPSPSAPAPPPAPAAGAKDGEPVASTEKPLRLGIFIKNRVSEIPDEKVMVLEDAMIAKATRPEIEIIPREDVVNAVSRFASEGANRGSGDPKAIEPDLFLSDRTSAASLSSNMGADVTLVGSIVSLTNSKKRLNDKDLGIDRTVHTQKLTVNYRILDGGTGGALASDDVVIENRWTSGGNLEQDAPPVDDLLRDAGRQLADRMVATIMGGRMRKASAPPAETMVQIAPSLVDLAIPEVIVIDGQPTVSSGRYKLEPMAVNIYIDGLLIGTAPGEFPITPGLRRIRAERPNLEPYEGMMKVRPGMTLTIPMRFSEEGMRRWRDNANFFQSLKERQMLTDAQVDIYKGFAEFLKQSNVKIDTSSVQSIGGTPLIFP